jgi:hypothetical protein
MDFNLCTSSDSKTIKEIQTDINLPPENQIPELLVFLQECSEFRHFCKGEGDWAGQIRMLFKGDDRCFV